MFLTQKRLDRMGFLSLGKNVLISDKASIYNPEMISIGDNSRIDDFAILSGGRISIGRYVHIACHATIIGKGSVTMEDYSGLSSRVAVYSSSDKYNGQYMTNPCIPEYIGHKKLRDTWHQDVYIGKHVVIGTGSTILPGITILDGAAVGAMSLVLSNVKQNEIVAGIPAKLVAARGNNIYELEKLLNEYNK